MSGYIEHVTAANDRWDLIAYRYYGDANRAALLIRANGSVFPPLEPIPLILPAGIVIKVPILDPEPVLHDLLPPWKQGAA